MTRDLKTEFLGYDTLETRISYLALIQDGQEVRKRTPRRPVEVVTAETPFYAESGGQAGDQGMISSRQGSFSVEETISLPNRMILHRGRLQQGALAVGDQAKLSVSDDRRTPTANNHTATHLLHGALRRILGEQVKQAGSLVTPQRLRFDFSHFSALTLEELQRWRIWSMNSSDRTCRSLPRSRITIRPWPRGPWPFLKNGTGIRSAWCAGRLQPGIMRRDPHRPDRGHRFIQDPFGRQCCRRGPTYRSPDRTGGPAHLHQEEQ